MSTVSLTLDEIFELAKKTLLANGCDDETASILSDLIRNAERDGSVSHGLFRLPAYVTGLKSGKINGKGKPEVKKISSSVIKVEGNNCLAPVVLNKGVPELIKAAKEIGSDINVTGYIRYKIGEGIEQKNDNFAEEVEKMSS
mgnify:CR=1 FL=1